MGKSYPSRAYGKETIMSNPKVDAELVLQKRISEWENLITVNLKNLADALVTASDGRLMSLEHAKVVWKSYLTVSGMDIPKDLKSRVLTIIEEDKNK